MKHLTKRIISVVMTVCLLVSMLITTVIPVSAAYEPKTVTLEAAEVVNGFPTFKVPDGVTLYVGDSIKFPDIVISAETLDTEYNVTVNTITSGTDWGQDDYDPRYDPYTLTEAKEYTFKCLGSYLNGGNWDFIPLNGYNISLITFTVEEAPADDDGEDNEGDEEYVYEGKTITLVPTGEYTSDGAPMFKLPDGVTVYVGDEIRIPQTYANIACSDGTHKLTAFVYTDGSWWNQEGAYQFDCRDVTYPCTTAGEKHFRCLGGNFVDDGWGWQALESDVIYFTVYEAPTDDPDAPETPEAKDIVLCWNPEIQKFVLPKDVTANVGDTLKFPAQPNLSTTVGETAVYGPIINVGESWENWGQPWGAGWSYTVKEGTNTLYAFSVYDIATSATVDTRVEILNINSGDIGTYVELKNITLYWDNDNNQFAIPDGVTVNVGDTLLMPASAPYFVGTEHSGFMLTVGTGWESWGQPWNGGYWSHTVTEGTNTIFAIAVYVPQEDIHYEIWEVALQFEAGTTGTYVPPAPPSTALEPIELTEAWENKPLDKNDWYGDIESTMFWDPYGINNSGRFYHTQHMHGAKYIWSKQPYDISGLDEFTVEAYLRMDNGWANYYGEYCSLYLGDEESNIELRISNVENTHAYVASFVKDGEVLATSNLRQNVNGTFAVVYLDEKFYVTYEGVALTWVFADDSVSKAITVENLDLTSEQVGLRIIGNYHYEERYWTNACLLPYADDSFTKDDSISKIVRLEYNPNHGDNDYFVVPEGVQINVGDLLSFPEENLYNSFGFYGYMVNVGTEVATGDWQHSDKWGQPWGGYSSDKEYGLDGTGWYAKVTVAGQNHIFLYEMWDPSTESVVNVNQIICSFESYDDTLNTVPEGMCGKEVSWRIEDGTLYLEGTGATFGYNNVGWVNPFIEHRWSIQNIVIGDGITHLGARLFRGLNHAYTLTFGADVETMDYEVFYGMTKLTTINFNDKIKSIGALSFTDNLYMESIDIPASVTRINNRAFKNCDGLASIDIPSTVVYLGHEVFYGCDALESVTFGATTDYLNACMFQNCTSLESFNVPASIKSIRSNVFAGSGLNSIVFEDELAMRFNYSSTRMYSNVFDGCEGLTMTSYKNGYVEYYAGKYGFDFVAEGMLGERLVGTAGEYTLNKEIVSTIADSYAVHVGGEGVHVTIQGGIYDGGVNGTTNALIVTDNGAVTIEDGLFKASGDVIRIVSGTVVITGGSFVDFDPTAYLADGYTVETSVDGESTVYTVVAAA